MLIISSSLCLPMPMILNCLIIYKKRKNFMRFITTVVVF
jgi:hypothetical protein